MLLATIGWPVLDRIHLFGDFAVSPHGIGIAIGVLFGAWIWSVEGPKRGVTVDHINTMLFWVLVGAIVGARLFWVIGHWSELDEPLDALRVWEGGLTLLGGIAGAVLVNIPNIRRYGYSFFQVLDGAMMGLAFGIAFGRIGDLIIGDHLGKPTSWLLAWQYDGGTPAGFSCVADACRTTLQGGKELLLTTTGSTLYGSGGEVLGTGTGVHQTALYDMAFATLLFLFLYGMSRVPRRLGVLTLTFGAWYGATRVIEDFLRVDKRIFGLTGSQWTGLTVSLLSLTVLAVWALRARSGPREPETVEADASP
ncbi:MAG TPA: prolipoprotein diacylglyceryl transferase family protein [Actinomycetota bacterium]|nr:prolipoprotein diacylglyceryl transferase family protein [Actinomycetota bacterium]